MRKHETICEIVLDKKSKAIFYGNFYIKRRYRRQLERVEDIYSST